MENKSYEVFGKYILLEKLAAGGMAEVFLARSPGTGGIGKFVAIKRILPQFYDAQEFIDMFKDEAKIAINLSHSNVVSIYEFGVEKNQFFLVMDYVEGRNLRQILNKMKKSHSTFSIDQIIYVCKEVAAGLDHAHRCLDGTTGKPLNITHRDMSPQNIMVSYEGEVKIVDFGIAKAESQLETTRAGTLKGKFGYMSPEQAEGQPVDLRTDIFSLGICLWELLANDRLFIANNEINTLRKIRDCQVPSLRKINPNIHAELERIVQKALARDRNLRYQTAAAMHRDLSRYLNRQFPDFSPHDYSVFVKTLFADEILEARRRLIEYSKVTFDTLGVQPSESGETQGRRIVTGPNPQNAQNNTSPRLQNVPANEKIIPHTGSSALHPVNTSTSGNQTHKSFSTERNTLSDSNVPLDDDEDNVITGSIRIKETTKVRPTESSSDQSEVLAKQKMTQNLKALVDKASVSSQKNLVGNTHLPQNTKSAPRLMGGGLRIGGAPPSSPLPSISRSYSTVNQDSGLDDNAIAEVMSLHQQQQQALERSGRLDQNPTALDPDLEGHRSPHQYNSSHNISQHTATSDFEGSPLARQALRLTIGTIFSLLIYSFAAKFYTAQMAPIINFMDPHLGILHSALGIDRQQITSSSRDPFDNETTNNSANSASSSENTYSPPPTPNLATEAMPRMGNSRFPSHPSVLAELLITSTPSGAEVYVNGVNTGKVTPSKIKVPGNDKFMISLKRSGYLDYERKDLLKSEVGIKMAATLQKALVGYLNIDVIPPRAARIYINGQRLSGELLPIFNYAVPAETWIVLRAEDPVGGLGAEEKVYLSRDQKKSITLYLKRKSRGRR